VRVSGWVSMGVWVFLFVVGRFVQQGHRLLLWWCVCVRVYVLGCVCFCLFVLFVCLGGRACARVDGWVDVLGGCACVSKYGWMDGWVDGWMDG
jgi:hypothetical protein